jgi:hypothetical protein
VALFQTARVEAAMLRRRTDQRAVCARYSAGVVSSELIIR